MIEVSDCLEAQQAMDKTVESYRMASDSEIGRWTGFAKVLHSSDRELFDEFMDACESFALESSNATNPIVSKP